MEVQLLHMTLMTTWGQQKPPSLGVKVCRLLLHRDSLSSEVLSAAASEPKWFTHPWLLRRLAGYVDRATVGVLLPVSSTAPVEWVQKQIYHLFQHLPSERRGTQQHACSESVRLPSSEHVLSRSSVYHKARQDAMACHRQICN